MPLHLCRVASEDGAKHRRSAPFSGGTVAAFALLLLLSGTPLWAQEKANAANGEKSAPQTTLAVAAPGINFRERPKYPTDPQRIRRTVQIDGVIEDGEWDPFYTVTDGPVKGTIYCNWDSDNLYLAARTDQPATVLFDVDAAGDGWLRGADNLEIVVGSIQEGSPLTMVVRQLDAGSKDSPSWVTKAIEGRGVVAAGKVVNGTQVVEIAIPKDTAGLVLRPGANIALRGEFLPAGPASAYIPTQPFEPHLLLDASLVETRIQAATGVNPRLTLSDYKCVPGQKLFATLELFNQTDLAVPIKSLLWTGRGGASSDAVNTLREVAVPILPPLKRLKFGYKTMLPSDLALGSYTMVVTAEMENGKQVESVASFTVVEPLQVQMSSDPDPVAVQKSATLTVNVDVFSAVPDHMHGEVELTTVPAGWELQGNKKRHVDIDREDARKVTHFEFRLPSNTTAGDYPVEAVVRWHGREWRAKHVARVIRTGGATATAPPESHP